MRGKYLQTWYPGYFFSAEMTLSLSRTSRTYCCWSSFDVVDEKEVRYGCMTSSISSLKNWRTL